LVTKRGYGADHSEVVDVFTARTWVLRVNQHYQQERGRTTYAGLQCDRTRAYLHKLHRYLVARPHDKAVVFADLDPFALLLMAVGGSCGLGCRRRHRPEWEKGWEQPPRSPEIIDVPSPRAGESRNLADSLRLAKAPECVSAGQRLAGPPISR
jgi:hypothetical protein